MITEIEKNAGPASHGRTAAAVWLAGTLYAGLCMAHWITRPVSAGLVFNDMLQRLLHGRFDISAAIIGGEAITYNGGAHTYFGIFCAFLRLPLLITGHNNLDVTGFSILAAASVSLACRLAIVAAIFNRAGRLNAWLRWAVWIAVAANGESIQYLVPSIYQEVICWGGAIASLFVLIVTRMVQGLSQRGAFNYAVLALLAGLALLCRVSFGLGLYSALGLMLLVELLQAAYARRQSFLQGMRLVAPAAAVLALFMVLTAGINYARWGNALTFIPMQYQLQIYQEYPDRPLRMARYGTMNIQRIPFSLQYYFAPVWVLTDGNGHSALESTETELYDDVEFPPGSLFLSDSVIFILAAFGIGALASRARSPADPVLSGAALLGLAVPPFMMLIVIGLTFRYRMEFYPTVDLAAWIGLAALLREQAERKYLPPLLTALAASGAVVAVVSFLSYQLIGFGPATDFNMKRGWIGLMQDKVAGRDVYLHPHPVIRLRDQPAN